VKTISFAWTTAALLAGEKTVTRRDWKPQYAARFQEGDLLAAYDRQPRFGGKRVATIRLTQTPYLESTEYAPTQDYVAEGFKYLDERGILVDGLTPPRLWRAWKLLPRELYVVRFRLVETC
jgi:hypothetical protein